MLTIPEICSFLSEHDGYLILTHKNPDADTLGSALTLCRLLNSIGKTARAVCSDKITDKQKKLFDGYTFEDDGTPYACVISVDVASSSLLGIYEDIKDRIDLMIDHHTMREIIGKQYYIKPDDAACGQIVFEICKYFEKNGLFCFDGFTASYLYAALSADTGAFKYSNTTPKTHRIAAELIEYGAKHTEIDEILHITKSFSKIRAEGFAASNLRAYAGGRIMLFAEDDKTLEENGFTNEDMADIVDIPRSVEGVEIAVSAKQDGEGKYKFSVRTKSADASKICAVFNGGGHVRASGCSIYADNIEEACRIMIDECIKNLDTEG